MKILIVANCLRWTIRDMLLSAMNDKVHVDVVDPKDDGENVDGLFKKCETGHYDYVITNVIMSERNKWYTANLHDIHSSIISFPSVRYHGENPYIIVIPSTIESKPPQTYHDLRVIKSWMDKTPVENINIDYAPDLLNVTHEQSIKQLESREFTADIKVSDIIKSNNHRKLFTSFHHPTGYMCSLVVRQILDIIGCTGEIADKLIDTEFVGSDVPFNKYDTKKSMYRCKSSNSGLLNQDQLLQAWYMYYDMYMVREQLHTTEEFINKLNLTNALRKLNHK